MPHYCRNLCQRESFKQKFKVAYGIGGDSVGVKRTLENKESRVYLNGYKRCRYCYFYCVTTSKRCPCCSYLFTEKRKRRTPRPKYEHEQRMIFNNNGRRITLENDIKLNKDKWEKLLNPQQTIAIM